jgi:hypothetical protein
LSFKKKIHSHPLPQDIGNFRETFDKVCDVGGFPQIPSHIKNEASRILSSIYKRNYPTKGIRREVFVVVALGIAYGSKTIDELKELVRRAEYASGRKIPLGQLENVFYEVWNFWKDVEYRHLYPWRSRGLVLTPEDKKILKFLKSRQPFQNFGKGFQEN